MDERNLGLRQPLPAGHRDAVFVAGRNVWLESWEAYQTRIQRDLGALLIRRVLWTS